MTFSTLQISQHRSGGFLTWTLIEKLQRAGGVSRRSYIQEHYFQQFRQKWTGLTIDHFDIDEMSIDDDGMYCDLDVLTRELILDPQSYVQACTHVWSDSAYHPRHPEVLPLFSSCVYIIRDPRDRLISLAEWQFTEYRKKYGWTNCKSPAEYIERNIISASNFWNNHFIEYYNLREKFGIIFIKYEDIIRDFEKTAKSIANHMGLELSSAKIAEIGVNLTFSEMKKGNPAHLSKGVSGRYRELLNSDQCALIEQEAKEGMTILGYI